MSTLITEIPPVNPIRFVQYKDATTPNNPQYNFVYPDSDLFQNTIQAWQLHKWYFEKVQLNQRITVQVHTQDNNGMGSIAYPPNLSLYDCISGAKVFDLNTGASGAYYIGSQIVTGNIDPDTNIQLNTHLWSAKMTNLVVGAEGFYQFILTTYDSAGVTGAIWRSEPIQVKTTHAKTLLLEYTPRPIQDRIVMAGWPNNYIPYFGMRVEGDIRNEAPTGNAVDYKDATYNQYQLDGVAWRTFKLKIGGQGRVPAYKLDKVNHIILTGPFAADGKQFIYVNDNGSSGGSVNLWSVTDPTTSPFIDGTVLVRENKISDSYKKVSGKILLFTSPGSVVGSTYTVTYPFAFPFLAMNDLLRGKDTTTGTKVFSSGSDQTAFLSYLNSSFVDLYDLGGTYSYDSITGNWYYTLGPKEYFSQVQCQILTTFLGVNLGITATSSIFSLEFDDGLTVFDWGDGSAEYLTGTSSTTVKSHTYAAISTPKLRIFTDNNMTGLTFNYHTTAAHITSFDGSSNVSSKLQFFTVDGTDLSALTSVDPSFLSNAAATIQEVAFTNTRIQAFSPDLFAATTNPSLIMVYLGNNQLSSTNVDDIIHQVKTSIWGVGSTSGIIDVRQTPTAPANTSAADFIALTSVGWSIFHD